MKAPRTLILYVNDPPTSGPFYARLFGGQVVESSPNFAMVVLPTGLALGLWGRHDIKPVPAPGASGSELCVTVETDRAVDDALAEASHLGCQLLSGPDRLDFGYTFLVAGPEGHLVRVFNPTPE